MEYPWTRPSGKLLKKRLGVGEELEVREAVKPDFARTRIDHYYLSIANCETLWQFPRFYRYWWKKRFSTICGSWLRIEEGIWEV